MKDKLDYRGMALLVARMSDVPVEALMTAYSVARSDSDFLVAVQASADIEEIRNGSNQGRH